MKAIIVISDLHIGSLFGLCDPGVKLDMGDRVRMGKFHRTVWRYWEDFWGNFVPDKTSGAEKKAIIINGDIIDGDHHDNVAIWANDVEQQTSNAVRILESLKSIAPIYVIRGTGAHSGPSSKAEETIGRELGAVTDEVDQYSRWQLWLDVDKQIFNIAHHIGVTSSAAYESSAPMRELVASLVEAAQWGQPLPNVIIRSHRHRFIPVPIPSYRGRIECVITPGWELKTPHVERIDRMRMPHIGGIVYKVEDGTCNLREKIYKLPDPQMVKI